MTPSERGGVLWLSSFLPEVVVIPEGAQIVPNERQPKTEVQVHVTVQAGSDLTVDMQSLVESLRRAHDLDD